MTVVPQPPKVIPISGAQQLVFSGTRKRVVITATFGPLHRETAIVGWNVLWNASFFKNNASKNPDSRVRSVTKRTATAEGPSKIRLSFVPSGNFGEIEVSTKDLRQALLAIK